MDKPQFSDKPKTCVPASKWLTRMIGHTTTFTCSDDFPWAFMEFFPWPGLRTVATRRCWNRWASWACRPWASSWTCRNVSWDPGGFEQLWLRSTPIGRWWIGGLNPTLYMICIYIYIFGITIIQVAGESRTKPTRIRCGMGPPVRIGELTRGR